MIYHSSTEEANAVRQARRAMRRAQKDDPLAKRESLIASWRKRAETNRAYIPHNGCWWWVFTWNPCFRDLLMPQLRARQDARERAHRQSYEAELRETAQKWRLAQAERKAAKARAKSPQADLLDQVQP